MCYLAIQGVDKGINNKFINLAMNNRSFLDKSLTLVDNLILGKSKQPRVHAHLNRLSEAHLM